MYSSNLRQPSQKYYMLLDIAPFIPPKHPLFPLFPQDMELDGEVEGVKKCGCDHLSICFKLSLNLTNLKPQPTLWNITASSEQ